MIRRSFGSKPVVNSEGSRLCIGPRGLAVDSMENKESLHEFGIEPKPSSV